MSKRDVIEFWRTPLSKSFKKASSTLFNKLTMRLPEKLRTLFWHIRNPRALYWYARHRGVQRHSYYDNPQPEAVFEAFKANNFLVHEAVAADYLPGFQAYLGRTRRVYEQAGYFRIFDEDGYFIEKALEHYLSLELLELDNEDLLLDAGAWGSPFAAIAEIERGCVAFSQDLVFDDGVHGRKIGSDVRNIPMPDESFTKIVAHCAIDNFEGDADIGFFREAWRMLKPGGSLLIIPLHMSTRFENVIDPIEKEVETDLDAIKVYKPLCSVRFQRHYDVSYLQKRALEAPFCPEIYYFRESFEDFHSCCQLRFAMKLTKSNSLR